MKALIERILHRQHFDLVTFYRYKEINNPRELYYHMFIIQNMAKQDLRTALNYYYMDNKNKTIEEFVSKCNDHLFKLYKESSKI